MPPFFFCRSLVLKWLDDSSYLRKPMTKQCIKIRIKGNSMN